MVERHLLGSSTGEPELPFPTLTGFRREFWKSGEMGTWSFWSLPFAPNSIVSYAQRLSCGCSVSMRFVWLAKCCDGVLKRSATE